MKGAIIIVCLFFSSMAYGQVFFNADRPHAKAVLIPTMHFGYSLKQDVFIEKNYGLEVKKEILPIELYFGVQILADGYMLSFDYGVLQKSIMLGVGFPIPIN